MKVLVVYASRYGATKGIAERIAKAIAGDGHEVLAVEAKEAPNVDDYDAVVVGSAAYVGSWMKEASDFVRRNQAMLARKPTWVFSSGPIGVKTVDEKGRDVREMATPKDFAQLEGTIHPRDSRVFFGALDHTKLGFAHRAFFALPASRKLLVEGDFRNWAEIEEWAHAISAALTPAHVT